jgi:S-DNA-T family DNA segregation ATPase FtsK/SpoIIIE
MKDRKEMINRLHEIADGLSAPLTDELTSIRSLHEVAREIMSLANSIGRRENVDIDEVWPDADDRSILKRHHLPIWLGISAEDEKLVVDLAKISHMLVGGKSGYGKTNLLNSIVCGLARLHSPENVQFVLFDQKCCEFTSYYNLPHLAFQVITESDKCMHALSALVREMDRRLKMFVSVLCRNIDMFNGRKTAEHEEALREFFGEDFRESEDIPNRVPYIVVVMDEIERLVFLLGEDFIALIKKLTAYGRAAGIHLIVATRYANDQTLPFPLRECFRYRVAFKTYTQEESRILLNSPDADVLCGRGDMLIYNNNEDLIRSQSAYLGAGKTEELVEFIKTKYPISNAVEATAGISFPRGSSSQDTNSENAKLDDEELYK